MPNFLNAAAEGLKGNISGAVNALTGGVSNFMSSIRSRASQKIFQQVLQPAHSLKMGLTQQIGV